MSRSPNLNRCVAWFELAPLLGSEPRSGAMPGGSNCPLCQGRLITYQCTTGAGQWHRCISCGFTGDSIELASRVWGLSPEGTVRKLQAVLKIDNRLFTPRAAVNYVSHFIEGRQRNNSLWERALNYCPSHVSELRGLHTRLKFPEPPSPEAWKERGGQHVGGLDREAIAQILWSHLVHKSNHNLFKRSSWKAALVLPLYDLPGRICAFMFIANDYRNNLGVVHHFALPLEDGRLYHPGGLALPSVLDTLPGPNGDDTLVLLNPVAALQLHIRHLSQRSVHLPVVGAWGAAETPAMLLERSTSQQFTIWAPSLDKDTFRHAAALNARITCSMAEREDLWLQLQHHEPHHWVSLAIGRSVPWEEALERHLACLATGEAEEVLLHLGLSAPRLETLLKNCQPELRGRIETIIEGRHVDRKVVFRGQTIVEDRDGWSLDSGESLCNASIRIERVVYQPQLNKGYYQGFVTLRGEKISFTAPKEDFDRSPGLWLSNHLMKTNRGVLVCGRRWTRDLTTIAELFHPPELVHSLDSYGWDTERQAFVFPGYLILGGGRVEENPSAGEQQTLPLPGPLTGLSADTLCQGAGVELAWATAMVLTAQLASPAVGQPVHGVAVYGNGAETALKLASAMGCPSGQMSKEILHGWPLIIRTNQVRNLCRVWLQEEAHNCLWKCDELEAHALGCRGWGTLNTNGQEFAPAELLAEAPRLVPALIQELSQYLDHAVKMGLPHTVTTAAQTYRANNHLPSLYCKNVIERVHDPRQPLGVGEHFVTLLCYLFEAGELGFEHASYAHPRWKRVAFPTMAYLNGKKQVWVPRLGLNSILSFHQLPPVDSALVTAALAQSGVLAGEQEHHNEPGWIIGEEWWNSHLRHYRARNKKPEEAP